MKNKKIIYWIIQFVSWGAFCGLIGITVILQGKATVYTPIKLLNLFVLLILSTQTIRWVFIKYKWLNLKMTSLIPRALLLIFILATIIILITNVIINDYFLDEGSKTLVEFSINVLLNAMFLILWTTVYLAFHLIQKSQVQEMNNLRLQAKQIKNELKVLRSQLNPHFLFNSLNNIRALIEIDPATAKSSITTLSSLLRSSLNLSKKSTIPLQEEIQLVKEFLILEKIRHEERLRYTIENNIVETINIPPFLVQGMVENAIKHGVSKLSNGGDLLIHTYYEKDTLILLVTNTGKYKADEDTSRSGIGIANTRRRLEILYADKAGFEIKNDEGIVKAKIWIKKEQLKQFKNESSHN